MSKIISKKEFGQDDFSRPATADTVRVKAAERLRCAWERRRLRQLSAGFLLNNRSAAYTYHDGFAFAPLMTLLCRGGGVLAGRKDRSFISSLCGRILKEFGVHVFLFDDCLHRPFEKRGACLFDNGAEHHSRCQERKRENYQSHDHIVP
jgi:hypothetical protein